MSTRQVHDGVPPGVLAADKEAGWREALAKLAGLAEGTLDVVSTGQPRNVALE